jgi:phosphatidylserine decarboxylase
VRIDPAGRPFVGAALGAAFLTYFAWGWAAAVPVALFGAFFLLFFRDPDRKSEAVDAAVLAPADGRVLIAGPAAHPPAPPGEWLQVSIFLSPLDVHVNRVPASGRVTRVSYTRGRFLPAYRQDAGSVNERSEIWIEKGGQVVVARQIVGVLARRVVCRLESGATVRAGDRFGIMKFGSRMDVFLPTTAEVLVRAGDRVRGGETVIAMLHSSAAASGAPAPAAER